jgi:4-amino-4-deoxy-L-arabinose transferase-like glycosyltransferase
LGLIALHAIFLVPLTLFLCFYHLDAGANLGTGTGIDESWYIQVAQEIKQSGRWWLPTREGEPFFFKPPLNFWLTAISSNLFGDTISSYRYVGGTFGVLFVALAYIVASVQFASLNAGFFSALTLLSVRGFLFTNGVRFATLDAPVTFYSALALVVMFQSVLRGTELNRPSQLLRGALVGALLAAAVLTKSVLGYYVYGILGLWMLFLGKPFRRVLELRWFFGAALLLSVCLPALWFVPHALLTPGALDRMVGYELVSRFGNGLHNSSNTWLYWDAFKEGRYLPFYGFFAALAFCVSRAIVLKDRSLAFFILWAVVPFFTFTALSSRLVWYLAPCYFPAAILCGGFLGVLIDRGVAALADSRSVFKGAALALVSVFVLGASLWETSTYLFLNVRRVLEGSPRLAVDELVHSLKKDTKELTVISYDAPSPATRERIFWSMLGRPVASANTEVEVRHAAEGADAFIVVTQPKHVHSLVRDLPVVGYRYLPPVTFPQGPEAIYRSEASVVLFGSRQSVKLKSLGLRPTKVVMKLAPDGRLCEEILPTDGSSGSGWTASVRGKPVRCDFTGDVVLGVNPTNLRFALGRKVRADKPGGIALGVWVNHRRVALIDRLRERSQEYSVSLPAEVLTDRINSVTLELVSSTGEPLSIENANNNQLLMRWVVVEMAGR